MGNIHNKKAFFHYEILDRFVAGLSLRGAEVKSLRAGHGSLVSAFVSIRDGEAFIKNFQIPEWEFSQERIDPLRDKKLLLKKREIIRLEKKWSEKGLTIVPVRIFETRGLFKIEIALARGKKEFDKRQVIKKRDESRQIAGRIKAQHGR